MIGSAREIHDLCSKVKDSAKAEPENLGHRVSTWRRDGVKDSCVHGLAVFLSIMKKEFCLCLILFMLFTCIFTCDRCNNRQLLWSLV